MEENRRELRLADFHQAPKEFIAAKVWPAVSEHMQNGVLIGQAKAQKQVTKSLHCKSRIVIQNVADKMKVLVVLNTI